MYFEQLFGNQFYILDQMDEFLERHKSQKWTQEEIVNLNNSIPGKEIEFIWFPIKKILA